MKQGVKELLYVILVLVAISLVVRHAKGASSVAGTTFHGIQGTIKALQGP